MQDLSKGKKGEMSTSGKENEAKGSPNEKKASHEILYVNWMRVTAIYLVVFVHILIALTRTIKFYEDTKEQYDNALRVFLQFGMPIFFYFSGRAAACGFRMDKKESKRSPYILPLIWIKKKFLRLIVPLAWGTIIFVIPTSWMSRFYRSDIYNDPNGKGDISLWNFGLNYFKDEFQKNGFEWLWFLPALFFAAVLSYPFFKLYQQIKRDGKGIVWKRDKPLIIWQLGIFVFNFVLFYKFTNVP